MSKMIEAPVLMGLGGTSRTQTMQVNRWLSESERVCTQRGKRNKNLVEGKGGARTALDRAVREGLVEKVASQPWPE